ncbi:MAG TPA: hypothetical protein VFV07_06585 [Rhizomicrobium sp.]|nr:hypothetical protein [Rhizomicrobium sp.]
MPNQQQDQSRPAGWTDGAESAFKDAEERYMPVILGKIRAVAAKNAESTEITFVDAFRAFEECLGQPVEPSVLQAIARFIRDNLFLIVAVILTLSFGWLAIHPFDAKAGTSAQSFLDIAKIFAGAIVGGAATGAVVTKRSSK